MKDTPKIDATEKDYDAFKTEIGDFLIVRSGNVGTYGIVDIDIPYPRTQETKMEDKFLKLKNYIWSQVYQEYLEVRK